MKRRPLRSRPLIAAALLATIWHVVATDAVACPGCPVGQEARQQVLADGHLGENLVMTGLPFLVVALVSRRASQSGRRREPRKP
jgi:hypothetical protein